MLNDNLFDFISARRHLIWYVDPENFRELEPVSVVEHTLNYGTWDDVQELIRIMGIAEVARIFRKQMVTRRQKGNYHPQIAAYFARYFDKHAPVQQQRKGKRYEKEFTARYKKQGQWYIGWVEEISGVNTQGRTLAEARENLKEALLLVLEEDTYFESLARSRDTGDARWASHEEAWRDMR